MPNGQSCRRPTSDEIALRFRNGQDVKRRRTFERRQSSQDGRVYNLNDDADAIRRQRAEWERVDVAQISGSFRRDQEPTKAQVREIRARKAPTRERGEARRFAIDSNPTVKPSLRIWGKWGYVTNDTEER